jgi:beta-glucosidase
MLKPVAELRGFAKTGELSPGASEKITITVSDDELASFDEARSAWVTEPGEYIARLGHSSSDFVENMKFTVKKERVRRVNNILAPVAPVNELNPTKP